MNVVTQLTVSTGTISTGTQVLPGLHLSKDNQKNLSFEVKDLVLYLGQVLHLSKYNVKKSSFEVNDFVLDLEGRRTTRTGPSRTTWKNESFKDFVF